MGGGRRHRARELLRRLAGAARAEHQERIRRVFTASPVGIGLSDEQDRLIAVNPALCALLGRSEEELLGRSRTAFTHPDDPAAHRDAAAELLAADDGVVRREERVLRPDGEVRWARLTVTTTTGPRGQPWTVTHVEDVTRQKEAQLALRTTEANLAATARLVRRLQAGEDPRSMIVEAARELAGASTAALREAGAEGLSPTATAGVDAGAPGVPFGAPAASAHAYRTGSPLVVAEPPADLLAREGVAPAQARALLSQPLVARGRVTAVLTVTWAHPVADLEDRAAQAVRLLADEAAVALDHARMVRELERSAVTDSLTGLGNRRGWDSRVEHLLSGARRTGHPLTVALLDLDRFKAYNDTHGHLAGDELLRALAEGVRGALRGVDVVARWGGDEFAIALPECGEADAARMLERVRDAVPMGQRCSIGYATWDGAEPLQRLLARADAALYTAKEAGRDTVVGR
ncbi:sensor domain-containing diguanylate cyclase [Quadrisphaera sp. DSM 44207]|uniref:sensor domain-containing diguanylate cyclase n=1 Tax=Quadrisphaera sp. DSM 44207 TaxID=1881057 RepID=UPI0008912522|nr:sensor domain-containing diguanylate cyclase [Quadrisphaera sp. DSM 44207]SDQ63550.1 PAS domain S-box-containing protein/diguanylate cyclase (GGDEF) domain-containing protein [Quadrisphaera sp. DSM 44207]